MFWTQSPPDSPACSTERFTHRSDSDCAFPERFESGYSDVLGRRESKAIVYFVREDDEVLFFCYVADVQ